MIKIYDGVVQDHVAELIASEMKTINLDIGMFCVVTMMMK